ncbi:MAG: hypothetical protein ACYDAO_02155 [Thermoplasmataceae archaeon]
MIGEEDHFHVIGREEGKWFFYRRVREELNPSEKEIFMNYHKNAGVTYLPSTNIMRIAIPELQGEFYEDINNIPGCRVSPVTLQSQGSVYISIEYPEIQTKFISKRILKFLNEDIPYERSIVFMGRYENNLPYLVNLFFHIGNDLSNISLIKTRWIFGENEIKYENQGIFQNIGKFVPKKYDDTESDQLIWRIKKGEVYGDVNFQADEGETKVVEINVKSKFFSDFYRNVIKNYSGMLYFGLKCEKNQLISYYAVEKHSKVAFLHGLQEHWERQARKNHKNCLMEITDLGSNNGTEDIFF